MKIFMQWMIQKRWFRTLVFSILVFAVVFTALQTVVPLRTMEFTALNQAYVKREKIEINPDIGFWNLTDDDIEMLRWPWAWDRFAQMVKTLDLYGIKAGVIQKDVFAHAGLPSLSKEQMEENINKLHAALSDNQMLSDVLGTISSTSHESLVKAMKDWPHMILSQGFLIPDNQNPSNIKQRSEGIKKGFLTEKIKAVNNIKQQAFAVPDFAKNLLGAINLSPLSPHLTPYTLGTGFMRVLPDEDGVIRQVPTALQYDGSLFYSQPVVAAAAYFDVPLSNLELQPNYLVFHGKIDPKTGKDLAIPIDSMGKMYVNWTNKEQLGKFLQAPFVVIRNFVTLDMIKEISHDYSFSLSDTSGSGANMRDMEATVMSKLSVFSWMKKNNLESTMTKFKIWWITEQMILEGSDLSEILPFLKKVLGSNFELLDLDLYYQSIFLNNAVKANWEEGAPSPTLESMIANEDYVIRKDRILLPFLESTFIQDPDDIALLNEAGFITVDEDFSADTTRVIVHHLDLSEEQWISDLVIKTNLDPKVLKDKFGQLYEHMKYREEQLRNGLKHTLFHLKRGTIDQVSPLYFLAPIKFNDEVGKAITIDLLDYTDKFVFIGLTATGLNALNPTPYSGRYTMASLTPTSFNTITTGNFIQRIDWAGPVAIFAYALLIFIFVFYSPAYISLPLTATLATAHYFSGLYLLEHQGLIVPLITPILSVLSAYIVANIYIYLEQQRERQKIRGMFSAMVSPEVLKIMEEEPDKFNLRGEKVEASMFSSDVSGFTSISEGVTAQELALILNLYLTPMSNLVMIYGGYVEKYEGDAIKADFGMPLPDPEHAWKACFSSILQQEELQVVQRMLQLKYGVMITARMGVNTGVVNAGNMGSINKMQYCAIGEEVAMAEELEPSNKMWETWIAISPECLRLSGDTLETRLLDIVEYPHVTIPVYELLGWKKQFFLDFWKGKPIPRLIIEGYERIIPEKILAYIDYYRAHRFEGNAFYELMLSSFEALEKPCLDFMKLNDCIEIFGLEKRYLSQLQAIDAQGIVVKLEDLDLVDRRELEGLIKARDKAEEAWLKILNGYLVELKLRTHVVNRLGDKLPQPEIDELLTAIDTLEKNCNCYIKRNKFPTADDRYGQELKQHLVSVLPNPSQGLNEEQIEKMRMDLKALSDSIKQGIQQFILKAKSLNEEYHQMMAEHGVVSQKKREVCEIFGRGRELYLKRQWDEATTLFQQGLTIVPDDGPCMKFTERCAKFKKTAPEDNWDGTWIADW